MTEILLVSWYRREAALRNAAASVWFARGITPLHGYFFNSRQNWYIIRGFFSKFLSVVPGLKLNVKQKFSGHI